MRRIPGISLATLAMFVAACQPGLASDPRDAAGTTLSVLTLNLHTYQEFRDDAVLEAELTESQASARINAYGELFDRIAQGIDELDPDIICLQEVGEWAAGNVDDPDAVVFGTTDSNMVHQILERLDVQYDYTMDWSHYGFGVWLEGSAVLSRYPIVASDSRFVSDPDNERHTSWKSRNIPMAGVDIPGIGRVNVFSVHLGWWDDEEEPSREQFARLSEWVDEIGNPQTITILCGDFNIPATSDAYGHITQAAGFSDLYALANPDGILDPTIDGAIDGWEQGAGAKRIDYILMNSGSPLEVLQAQRVFTEEAFGRVSDHVGVSVTLEHR